MAASSSTDGWGIEMTETTDAETRIEITVSEAINRAMAEAMERDEPIMHLGQDIGPYGGTFGVTRGLYERFGGDVVRDGPLCESSTVGFAIGLAISGVRAIVEIEFFDFVGVAMDQIFQPGGEASLLHLAANSLSRSLSARRSSPGWVPVHSTRKASRPGSCTFLASRLQCLPIRPMHTG